MRCSGREVFDWFSSVSRVSTFDGVGGRSRIVNPSLSSLLVDGLYDLFGERFGDLLGDRFGVRVGDRFGDRFGDGFGDGFGDRPHLCHLDRASEFEFLSSELVGF